MTAIDRPLADLARRRPHQLPVTMPAPNSGPIDHGGKVAEQFGLTFEMDAAAKNVLKAPVLISRNEMPMGNGYSLCPGHS
jgi:hypothetical protein